MFGDEIAPPVPPSCSVNVKASEAMPQLVALHAREDACGAWEATPLERLIPSAGFLLGALP
jgi:hypothetical protein